MGIAYEGAPASFVDESFAAHLLRVSSARRTRVGLVVGDAIPGPHPDVDAARALAQERVQALVHRARGLLEHG